MKRLLLLIFLSITARCFGTCVAVAPTSSGTASGNSWANAKAYSSFSPTAFARGNIYYFADGNYGTDLTVTTAASGTTTVIFKKAQAYDFGRIADGCPNDISTGWNPATMGSAQAIWNNAAAGGGPTISFGSAGYYIFNGNGQTANPTIGCGAVQANPPASMTAAPNFPSDCGFKWDDSTCTATSNNGCDGGNGFIKGGGPGIQLLSMEIKGQGLNPNGNNNSETYGWFANGSNLTGVIISHVYWHNMSTTDFTSVGGGWDAGSFDHNYSWGIFDGSVNHGEAIQLQGDNGQVTPDNIFSNIFRDQQTNGDVVAVITGTQTYNFYDNVDFCSTGGTSTTCRHNDGVIGCFNSQTCANVNVYNNTFSFPDNCGWNVTGGPSTMNVENNVYFNCGSVGMSGGTNVVDYNSYLNSSQSAVGAHDKSATGVANNFVNLAIGNVNLVADGVNFNNRLALSSPYNVDIYNRGYSTDKGAAQFTTASCVLTPNLDGGYPYPVVAGEDINIGLTQTGCPAGTIATFTQAASTVTFTGTGLAFPVGSHVQVDTGTTTWPQYQNVDLTVTASSSTSFTANYTYVNGTVGTTSVTGTATQFTHINWSVQSVSGGANATLGCTSNCIPMVNVKSSATPGTISVTGSLGSYTLSSTQAFNVIASSVDDPSQSTSTPFLIGANTTVVMVSPASKEIYKGQKLMLKASIIGIGNKDVTWTVSGTGCAINTTTNRTTILTGSSNNRCSVTATSVGDATKSDTAVIYVSNSTLPSYASAPPNGVEPYPCEVDPSMTGTAYDVGPSKPTYHVASDIPEFNSSIGSTPGTTIRFFNEDLTGTNPTKYTQYVQLKAAATAGTPGQPFRICGVPDSLGNLPIIEASNATAAGASWMNNIGVVGYGMINILPSSAGACTAGTVKGVSCGPGYVDISGLKIQNQQTGFNYFDLTGTSQAWNGGNSAGAVNIRSGYGISVSGVDFNNDFIAVGTQGNANSYSLFAITYDVAVLRNRIQNYMWAGQFLDHGIYYQSWGGQITGNLILNPVATGAGNCIKNRGISILEAYNQCGPGAVIAVDIPEVQDASQYVFFLGYLGPIGATGACASRFPFCAATPFTADQLAGAADSTWNDNVVYGNILNPYGIASTGGGNPVITFANDHDTELSGRYGKIWAFYNTVPSMTGFIRNSNTNSQINYLTPKFYMANNVLWTFTNPGPLSFDFWNQSNTQLGVNVIPNYTYFNITPTYGFRFNTGANMFANDNISQNWVYSSPRESHSTGITAGNFVRTATTPFNTTTFVPVTGSASIGAAGALAGEALKYPVDFNAVNSAGVVTPRTDLTTIGASDPPPAGTSGEMVTGKFKLTGNAILK